MCDAPPFLSIGIVCSSILSVKFCHFDVFLIVSLALTVLVVLFEGSRDLIDGRENKDAVGGC